MVVISQAAKLSVPNPCLPSSPPQITSALYEPNSLSLALLHSDSSISLYSSISPFSLSSFPSTPQISVPSPAFSASFLRFNHTSNPNPRVAFIVVGPHRSQPKLVLRLYVLKRNNCYGKAEVFCKQKGVCFDEKLGVLLDINHGVGLKLVGSVNFFAMYSFSASKIWVFGVRLLDGDDDGVRVKLMRCAVIECCKPVWSLSLSSGFMILGEDNGVRVLNMRSLVKGKMKKVKNSGLANGIIGDDGFDGASEKMACNGCLGEKTEKHHIVVKQRSVKYRQDSGDGGACFLTFRLKEVRGLKSAKMPLISLKAISIEAVSPKKFLVLDSGGDLHLLHLSSSVAGSNITGHIRQLPHVMNVQKLAIHPDSSLRTRTIWVTDGYHSVHLMDVADNEIGRDESDENLQQYTVIEAIFVGEKIQDISPMSANGLLILGQGNLYAYANS